MSTSVLPQLLEVDSELSAQATSLEAQLAALQEKRQGIQTVIAMFESGNTPAAATVAAATSGKTRSAKTVKKVAKKTRSKSASKAKVAKAKPAAESVDKTAKTKTRKVKATRGRPAKAKASSAGKKAAGKRSGRTANWQRYVQDSYSKAALPDVIVGVLKAKPDNIFKIADVMNAVFKEDMPKTHFLKARNRVSNILSAGARDGDWYRGRGGTYSVSEKAIKAVG